MNESTELIAARQRIISALTEARMEAGISQQELAERVGTQKSNISRFESGRRNVSLDTVLKIASALNREVSLAFVEKAAPVSRYSLRLYDEELLTFSMEDGGLAGMKTKLLSVNEDRLDVFPLDLELTGEGIFSWLRKRSIPKNRAFVDEILKTLGLSINNTKGIIDVCRGLSLNDSYWVVPEGFDGKFSACNLYENRFSSVLSLVAYTGVGRSGRPVNTTSPELTTHGMLRKAWRFIEGKGIYLFKGGTEGAANAGNEPYSEYYAYQIAERMGLHAVRYDLENWKGILASTCKLFTDIDTAYVPIGRIVRTGGLPACLDYYAGISREAADELRSMLVFDAVIYNEDRHFGNFGILRDNRSGRILGAAPIFDNGLSLFNFAMQDDIDDLEHYAKTRSNPYNIPYETVCREIMGPLQRRQLHRLINFQFTRHPSLNLPERRLRAIEEHLQKRVRELLALPGR